MYNGTLSSDPVIAAAEIREVAEHITVTRYVYLSLTGAGYSKSLTHATSSGI